MLLGGCGVRNLMSDAESAAADIARQRALQNEARQRLQDSLTHADALLRSGDSNKARGVLDAIDTQQLDASQQAQFALLNAQIDLNGGNAEQALQQLNAITPQDLPPENRRTYHQARAFAYSLTDRPLDAVRAKIALEPLLTNVKERNENQTAIFDALNQLPPAALQNPPDDELGGWMALALLFKQHPQGSSGFKTALRQWRRNYPRHPADLKVLRHYTQNTPGNFYPLRTIALLLPESGPFAQAAQAVKAGFLAAEKTPRGDKPTIRFYNSSAALPGVLYQQALNDGANLVIGPLEKDKLKLLAETTPLTVPVLALNAIPELSAPNLYQFTLSPIDEAEQAALLARSQGHRKAAILVPATDLGKRIAQGYSDAWRRQGGVVLKTVYFDPNGGDFAPVIEKLLNFDESASRYRQVSELIPGLQFTPRQRGDIEVIFLTAEPAAARALNQQLQAYRGSGLAVYATPHLYSNSPDPAQDENLDGITFCDIPWFFPGGYRDAVDAMALQAPWKQMQSIYLRLLAMGIDAYNLSGRLAQLDKEEYSGATGNLLRLPDGRIRRNLMCARFANGIPEPLGVAATPGNADSGATEYVEDPAPVSTP